MTWLARLDARVSRWPRLARWPYHGVKWLLVAIGAYLAIGSAWVEFSQQRPGIGLGILTMVILATIKGVLMAVHRDP